MGAGAAEFDGLRQDIFQRGEVEFVFAVPAADFLGGVFGNQPVAADDFAGGVVEGEEVVAVLVVRVDVAAVIAFDFRTQFLGEDLIAQALRGFDFGLGFGKAYAQADFGTGLVETALRHSCTCLNGGEWAIIADMGRDLYRRRPNGGDFGNYDGWGVAGLDVRRVRENG